MLLLPGLSLVQDAALTTVSLEEQGLEEEVGDAATAPPLEVVTTTMLLLLCGGEVGALLLERFRFADDDLFQDRLSELPLLELRSLPLWHEEWHERRLEGWHDGW